VSHKYVYLNNVLCSIYGSVSEIVVSYHFIPYTKVEELVDRRTILL